MRCPDCAKFAALEIGEPEVEVAVESAEGNNCSVQGSVRIVLTCADCFVELKESQLDVDALIELEHKDGCDGSQELEVEFEPEAFDEFVPPNKKRQKHMYGASGTAEVTCPCGAKGTVEWRGSVQSSHMEELT